MVVVVVVRPFLLSVGPLSKGVTRAIQLEEV